MNIQTAAGYMKHAYRIRRASWALGECIDPSVFDDGEYLPFHLGELLADDWEIITEGIVKDFPLTYSD